MPSWTQYLMQTSNWYLQSFEIDSCKEWFSLDKMHEITVRKRWCPIIQETRPHLLAQTLKRKLLGRPFWDCSGVLTLTNSKSVKNNVERGTRVFSTKRSTNSCFGCIRPSEEFCLSLPGYDCRLKRSGTRTVRSGWRTLWRRLDQIQEMGIGNDSFEPIDSTKDLFPVRIRQRRSAYCLIRLTWRNVHGSLIEEKGTWRSFLWLKNAHLLLSENDSS